MKLRITYKPKNNSLIKQLKKIVKSNKIKNFPYGEIIKVKQELIDKINKSEYKLKLGNLLFVFPAPDKHFYLLPIDKKPHYNNNNLLEFQYYDFIRLAPVYRSVFVIKQDDFIPYISLENFMELPKLLDESKQKVLSSFDDCINAKNKYTYTTTYYLEKQILK
ncbi:hypothetical protein [Mycoplasma crocodyli]|uniref:Uncharacterized protein n=1 Tax=Mycoplasma crocodyli (strain ATCC 51981 / MP145) TaxID=512564 RepID=D5E5Q2_MYCCM|nr:hypothetical protein [Mycoplasma crocodyli]ADE19627.1 conserved hypothetical protein [Mycoplasma crocodyli MP145]